MKADLREALRQQLIVGDGAMGHICTKWAFLSAFHMRN